MSGPYRRQHRRQHHRQPVMGDRVSTPVCRRYLLLSALLVVAVVLFASVQAHAKSPFPVESPSATARIAPAILRLERAIPAEFTITVTPPPGNHAYLDAGKDGALLPIDINLSAFAQAGLQVRPVSKPKGEWDELFSATVLRGEGVFRYRLTAPSKIPAGTPDYAVTVRSQVCNDIDGACYFPHVDTLHLQVVFDQTAPRAGAGHLVTPAMPRPKHPAPSALTVRAVKSASAPRQAPAPRAGTATPIDFSRYTPRTSPPGHSLLVWMLLAFVAGLLLNVMPCVLPVVSIKVLSFVQQAGESRQRVLAMGLVFAAGMLTVFLALAGAAIVFGLSWGQQFQSQVFLIVMIALVFALALSLFGVYEFGVPAAVGTLAANSPREGFGGVYLKGMLATLLATPCSGPLLGSTLAWTLIQPPLIVLLIFAMLGLGMAVPYVVLTAQLALLARLPKPGPWMDTFQQLMGFLLIATVVYLMISLDQHWLIFTVMLLVFVALGAWIWGRFAWRMRSALGRLLVPASALLIVGSGAYLSFHTLPGVLHPPTGTTAALTWEPFNPVKLQQYQRDGRSVMLDFTADWCANCTFNEVRVYNSATVRQLLQEKHVVVMKADLTREGPATGTIRQLMTHLGARSIPFLAVFPGDQPTKPYTLYDLVDQERVRHLLTALPNK